MWKQIIDKIFCKHKFTNVYKKEAFTNNNTTVLIYICDICGKIEIIKF